MKISPLRTVKAVLVILEIIHNIT